MAKLRWATASLAGALTACAVYAADRTLAALREPPVDPRAIIATARVDYFWRVGMAAFVGTIAALLVVQVIRGDDVRVLTWVTRAAPFVIAACAVLSAAWP